ncbi:MAG: hypothetical protein QXS91_02275 [Candidatus Anstonellales archaeon]
MDIYIELFLVVLIANILPAFAPPTWLILSRYQIKDNLDVWQVILIGVIAAALGRLIMYYYSSYFMKFLPEHKKQQLHHLRMKLMKNKKAMLLFMFIYSLGPLPSNIIFILAGVSSLPILPIITGFVLGRLISYGFGVITLGKITSMLEENNIHVVQYLDLLAFLITIGLLFIDWHKHLRIGKHENRNYRRHTSRK